MAAEARARLEAQRKAEQEALEARRAEEARKAAEAKAALEAQRAAEQAALKRSVKKMLVERQKQKGCLGSTTNGSSKKSRRGSSCGGSA